MNYKIGVIGIGYVGLPLSIEFGKYYKTIAYDTNKNKIIKLKKFTDTTNQINKLNFIKAKNLMFTYNHADLNHCNVFIVCVPTPVNKKNLPDLKLLRNASKLIGSKINNKDIIIYESTVYPGTTEDVCVPILEKYSKLTFNKDFFCGYSPERINPGDKKNTITSIKKITSGSTPASAKIINSLYKKIINAGTYMAESIKIAEAAKVIENTQRDVNIALINELSIIFNYLNLDTNNVLKAASTKWNFLPFKPGLVGGHCIGVDPYYLTYASKKAGHIPKMILSGRAINNNMHKFLVSQIKSQLIKNKITKTKISILLLGLSFKENIPDFRNSKSFDLYESLKKISDKLYAFDPYLNFENHENKKKINILKNYHKQKFDVIIFAVAHKYFLSKNINFYLRLLNKKGFIYDIKNILPNHNKVKKL